MTATDTFAAFLETMAETLDLGSEERARRLHLSRFHLDRIVSATGGEPPERMRRRVLLERAAFQLAVTDRQVVDVALEAGFGSHEAFTRAFRREYGAPPARWRRHPTRTQIDAPSAVHFHPPGSLRLPTTTKVTPMDLLTRMVEHHIWLTGELLDRAARLTDAQLDQPIEVSVGTIDDDMSGPLRPRPARRPARAVERRLQPSRATTGTPSAARPSPRSAASSPRRARPSSARSGRRSTRVASTTPSST